MALTKPEGWHLLYVINPVSLTEGVATRKGGFSGMAR
jgi:hypothetical protein